jgi:hypothetical protein
LGSSRVPVAWMRKMLRQRYLESDQPYDHARS